MLVSWMVASQIAEDDPEANLFPSLPPLKISRTMITTLPFVLQPDGYYLGQRLSQSRYHKAADISKNRSSTILTKLA
jgi:hypothetical protein